MDLQITHKTSSTKAAVQKRRSTYHIFLLDWQEVDFKAEENVPFEQQSQEFVVKVKKWDSSLKPHLKYRQHM